MKSDEVWIRVERGSRRDFGMKWTVLIGILGVAAGYLWGSGREVLGG